MDSGVLLFASGIFAVIATVATLYRRKTKQSVLADNARARVRERVLERHFQDTCPKEIISDFGVPDLDDKQIEVISCIMEGYGAPIIKESFKKKGVSANVRAGVPVSQSAFNDLSEVDLDKSWMSRNWD